MALDPQILRDSFQLVVSRNPQITERFYEILFERNPEVKPMFSESARKHQPAKLAAALAAVVKNIEDGQWLQRTLGEMGRRHVEYGATREMYAPVGGALIAAMAEAAADDWTPELETQWVTAYGAIVDIMCPEPAVLTGAA